jgi:hypothetical protein
MAAQSRPEAGRHAFPSTAAERPGGDVEDARPGRDGEHKSCGEEQGELGEVGHDRQP